MGDFWGVRWADGGCTVGRMEEAGMVPLDPGWAFLSLAADGFDWGCTGNKATQLAFAVLLAACGDPETARALCVPFKYDKIATLPRNLFRLTTHEVKAWSLNSLARADWSGPVELGEGQSNG